MNHFDEQFRSRRRSRHRARWSGEDVADVVKGIGALLILIGLNLLWIGGLIVFIVLVLRALGVIN